MKRTVIKIISLTLLAVLLVGSLTSCKKDVGYVRLTIKDLGDVVIKLDREQAPATVENFVKLVEDGFYDGLTFHRVIENFMIQGGCPKGDGTGNTGSFIKGEFTANGHPNSISHSRGVVSMARGGYSYDSASCQFFICVASSTHLDGEYAAFGYVVEGMDVVDAVVDATAHLATNGIVPKSQQIVIEKAEALTEYPS